MLMALLLLLVALMVSAVIISAALSAAASVREDREEQQLYLTVSSAAELVRDELESGACDKKTTVTNGSYTWRNKTYSLKEEKDSLDGDGAFIKIINAGISQLDEYSAIPFEKEYTFSADGYENVVADVSMSLDNDGNYTLTVWFSGGENTNECRICLEAKSIKKDLPRETKSETKSIWVDGYYKRSGWRSEYVEAHYENLKCSLTIDTTTLTWNNVKLSRKEAA